MKIKRDDNVIVISGKDKGKKGKVLQVFPEQNLIVVEGVNKMFKHLKPQRGGEKGQKIEYNGPVHVSNVMLIDESSGKPSRVGYKVQKDGKKTRIAKKSGEVIS